LVMVGSVGRVDVEQARLPAIMWVSKPMTRPDLRACLLIIPHCCGRNRIGSPEPQSQTAKSASPTATGRASTVDQPSSRGTIDANRRSIRHRPTAVPNGVADRCRCEATCSGTEDEAPCNRHYKLMKPALCRGPEVHLQPVRSRQCSAKLRVTVFSQDTRAKSGERPRCYSPACSGSYAYRSASATINKMRSCRARRATEGPPAFRVFSARSPRYE
jgi:hypothetical protein